MVKCSVRIYPHTYGGVTASTGVRKFEERAEEETLKTPKLKFKR